MNIDKDCKLFQVEIAKNDKSPITLLLRFTESVYVIARTYDEAADKAMTFVNLRGENESVIDNDGSLNLKTADNIYCVKAVKIVCDELIY